MSGRHVEDPIDAEIRQIVAECADLDRRLDNMLAEARAS